MIVYRDSAGNLIEAPDTTVTYESSTDTLMDGLPDTTDPYRNAAGRLMVGDPNFPRGVEGVRFNITLGGKNLTFEGKNLTMRKAA